MNFKEVEPRSKIIWDSGFGYEVGYFIRVADDIMYDTVIVELITGMQKGNALRTKDSINWYSDEALSIMYQKYKYYNHFPSEENSVNCNQLN